MEREHFYRACCCRETFVLSIVSMVFLVSLPALAGRHGMTDVELDTGRHAYTIWLDKARESHPMTVDEQSNYCASAQAFAQGIWDATNGRHRIENVHFHYDAAEPVGGYDIHWMRYSDVQNAETMYDRMRVCRHKWTWVGNELTLALADEPCPTGTACDPNGDPGREECKREGESFPTDPLETGFVLLHETSHYNYDLDDEYTYSSTADIPTSFGWCDNPEFDVSIMAVPSTHWCDRLTHTNGTRMIEGIPVTVPGKADADDNLWYQLKRGAWVDLYDYYEGTDSPLQGEYITNPPEPLTFDANFCTFGGTGYETGTSADIILAVDRSGSMNYEGDFSAYTAFEGAFAAGLEQYNLTGNNRKAGVIAFNSQAEFLIPYDIFSDYATVDDFSDIEATGTTNICDAIELAAGEFRQAGVTDKIGALILLTDGLPTTSGCSRKSDVISAAQNACGEWGDDKRLAISAVAYGDADYDLINQITQMCGGGEIWAVDHNSPEQPLDLHMTLSRAAYRQRAYTEAAAVKEPTASTNIQSFYVPEGTSELVVSWIGESFYKPIIIPGVEFAVTCQFKQIQKTLLNPTGVAEGTELVPDDIEADYYTKTLRVLEPTAGVWTMAADASFECLADNLYYTGHVPLLGQAAYLKGSPAKGELTITPKMAGLNEPVKIEAILNIGRHHAMTHLTVNGTVSIGNIVDAVTLTDDGQGGDEIAGDAVYTGIFNADGTNTLPGIRRVVVSMNAEQGEAESVLRPENPGEPVNDEPPIPATVILEDSLYIKDCGTDVYGVELTNCTDSCGFDADLDPIAGCDVSHCEFDENDDPIGDCIGTPGEVVCTNNPFVINPGETAYDLELTVRGHAVGSRRVTVGIGPGIHTFVTSTAYDADRDESTIFFNATAREIAAVVLNDAPVTVGFAGRTYSGKIAYCDAGDVQNERIGVFVTNSMTVHDRARVVCPAMYNSGFGEVHVGTEAVTGTIQSNGPVHVANNVVINGSIFTAGRIDFDDEKTVDIQGDYYENIDLDFSNLPYDSLDGIVFPSPQNLPPFNPSPTPYNLAPNSYSSLVVNSGATVILSAGTYYFGAVAINSEGHVLVDDPTSSVAIFVSTGIYLHEPIIYASQETAPVYIGYTGNAPAWIESTFDGTLIAPNAQVVLGTAANHVYSGTYVAKDLLLGPDTVLTCRGDETPSIEEESCEDGILNQDETDIDCGGICPGCADGSPCDDNKDCQSDFCDAGICGPARPPCSASRALDIGAPGQVVTVDNNACLKVQAGYPIWWGVRNMQLQPIESTSYPLPFEWGNGCTQGLGNGEFRGNWQSAFFGLTDNRCPTIIELQGDGRHNVRLTYYAG